MNIETLCLLLKKQKAEIIYIIHSESIQFPDTMGLERFADDLRSHGFIPLIAKDFRPYGKEIVSHAIGKSDLSVVYAHDKDTYDTAKKKGVPFLWLDVED